MALGVEDPGRFYLRQGSDQLFQPQMQQLLARNDVGIGNVADDLGDLRQAAVDGLEYFQRMFVRDIKRAFDLAIGRFADRGPGDGGGKYKQGQRKGQRSDHHPLQQSQRITLCGLHGRSDSVASLTQSLVGNKVPSMEPRWLSAVDACALICFKLQMPGAGSMLSLSPEVNGDGSEIDPSQCGVGGYR